jgi:hypothetical protein
MLEPICRLVNLKLSPETMAGSWFNKIILLSAF